MQIGPLHWGRAAAGALIAQIAQIAAAVVWVAIYSHVLNPGQPFETYQSYAQASGPWVSIIAGFPIFYAASRWIARSMSSSLTLFAIFLAIDVTLVIGMVGLPDGSVIPLIAASYVTKLIACAMGGYHAGMRNNAILSGIKTA